MKKLNRLDVELTRNIFQLHGINRTEASSWCRRLKLDNWVKVLLNDHYDDLNRLDEQTRLFWLEAEF